MPQSLIVDNFSENKNVKFMGGGKESIWTSITGRVLVFFSSKFGLSSLKTRNQVGLQGDPQVFAMLSLECKTQPNLHTVPKGFKCKLDLEKIFVYFCHLECSLLLRGCNKIPGKAAVLREEVWEGSVYLGGKGMIIRAWGCTLTRGGSATRKKGEPWCSAFFLPSFCSVWELSPWCGTMHIQGGAYLPGSLWKYPHLSRPH